MVKYSYKIKKTVIIMVAATFLLGGFVFVLPFSKADFVSTPIEELELLYVVDTSKTMYLSPNKQYLSMTYSKGYKTISYITDTNGNRITDDFTGSFAAWYPDSKKVALYLPIEATGKDREIFYLDIEGNYYKSDLPSGIISLDISNAGDIVYALTDSQTDYADLYIRESDGDERLIRNNENDVTVWTRWSPDGQKIAFLKFTSVQDGGIWLINSDGSNIKRVSDVNWNYPPIWSHNGKKILFASGANIFEYDTEQNNLESKTSFISGFVKQPNYAVGEDVVVFSRDFNQESQIWSTDINRITKQLTETKQLKTYPVMVYEINE